MFREILTPDEIHVPRHPFPNTVNFPKLAIETYDRKNKSKTKVSQQGRGRGSKQVASQIFYFVF